MSKWVSALGAMSLATVMFATACGDDTGDGTASGSGAGGSAGQKFGGGGCDTCIRGACSAEISTCGSDAGCAAWLACLQACPIGPSGDADATCEATCLVDGTVAAEGRDAIVACRRSGAGASCAECGAAPTSSTSTGGPGVCTMPAIVDQTCGPSGAEGCNACLYDECCDSIRDVFGSGPAADLVTCWLACPDDDGDCANDCYADHPDGIQGFGNFRACAQVNCYETGLCPSPRDNACSTCQRTECNCEVANCHADVSCHQIYECFANCEDGACAAGCPAKYPDGQTLYDNMSVCTAQHCVTLCAK